MDPMQFLADKLIAQEIATSMLIEALAKLHPEVTRELMSGLDRVLKTSPMPTPGSRANLIELRAAIAKTQPNLPAGH